MTEPILGSEAELRLRVGTFEGPLDLLLHLCRTNEIDLAALPVRAITDQYLAHLEALEFQNLEIAGAYLVMAATLIYLKSKRLRPREIEPNPPSVLERMSEILSLLRDTWSLLFSSMVGGERKRSEVVVSLLAVLELCRQGKIRTQQTELFGDIVIEAQPATAETAAAETPTTGDHPRA